MVVYAAEKDGFTRRFRKYHHHLASYRGRTGGVQPGPGIGARRICPCIVPGGLILHPPEENGELVVAVVGHRGPDRGRRGGWRRGVDPGFDGGSLRDELDAPVHNLGIVECAGRKSVRAVAPGAQGRAAVAGHEEGNDGYKRDFSVCPS